jgi:starvation-inducible DNA-binding protein
MATKTQTKPADSVDTGLPAADRAEVTKRLNALVADENILSVKLRNYHWNVTGVHFPVLHEVFEEQYEEIIAMTDEIAERARMLGGVAIGTAAAFLAESRLKEAPARVPAEERMLADLLDDHEHVVRIVREDIDACMEEYGDEGTADLLIDVMRMHEKMAWMLRATLDR